MGFPKDYIFKSQSALSLAQSRNETALMRILDPTSITL